MDHVDMKNFLRKRNGVFIFFLSKGLKVLGFKVYKVLTAPYLSSNYPVYLMDKADKI